MKLHGVKMRGIGRFAEETTMPIDELGSAKLVAVIGENGEGKSTALEMLLAGPYRWTPSRGQVAGMASARDSLIETMIETDQVYTQRLMINGTAKTKTTRAYLIDADGEVLNDGKTTTFDAEIVKRFPSKELVLASIFAAQTGTGSFLSTAPAKRKELFIEMLLQGRLQELSDAAGERLRTTEETVRTIQAKIGLLRTQSASVIVYAKQVVDAKVALEEAESELQEAEKQVEAARENAEAWATTRAELDRKSLNATHALDNARGDIQKAEEDHDRLVGELAKTSAKRATLEAKISERVELLATMEGTDGVDEKVAAAELQLEQETRELAKESAKLHREETEATNARDAMETKMGTVEAQSMRTRASIRDSERQLETMSARLAERAELHQLVDSMPAQLDDQLKDKEEDLKAARQEWKDRQAKNMELVKAAGETDKALQEELTKHQRFGASAWAAFESYRKEIDHVSSLASSLGDEPCSSVGQFAECKFIKDATSARDDLPGMTLKLEGLSAALEKAKIEPPPLVAAREAVAAVESLPGPIFDEKTPRLDEQIATLRYEITKRSEAVAKIEGMGDVEAQTTELESTLRALRTEFGELDNQQESAREEYKTLTDRMHVASSNAMDHSKRSDNRERDALNVLRNAAKTRAAAETRLSFLSTVDGEADELDRQAESMRGTISAAGDKLSELILRRIEVANVAAEALKESSEHAKDEPKAVDQERLKTLRIYQTTASAVLAKQHEILRLADEAKSQLVDMTVDLDAACDDIDDWKHLQDALGRNGIQALEIAAASPEVDQISNEVLYAGYGNRFSVSLETLDLKADGKSTKEVFDLRVIDSERGTDGSAMKLSVGERVLVSEALQLAVAIYNTRRSGIQLLDLVRDECAGALSATNAVRYIGMLRKAMDIGGFNRCYYVAHQSHLWDLADAIIETADGQFRVTDSAGVTVKTATDPPLMTQAGLPSRSPMQAISSETES